jgi:hypothetical protein
VPFDLSASSSTLWSPGKRSWPVLAALHVQPVSASGHAWPSPANCPEPMGLGSKKVESRFVDRALPWG